MQYSTFIEQAHCYPWHESMWTTLAERVSNLGHALLLAGKRGCGNMAFAALFAKWLLCEQSKVNHQPCGICQSCHWFQAGTHPQLHWISPEFDEKNQKYTAIKVDQIRALTDFIWQTSTGWKVVIIYLAEQLNIAASNALLKTLEEPNAKVTLLLISQRPLTLSATIRSRVQHFALDRISPQQASLYLAETLSSFDTTAQVALELAQYMPLYAQHMLQQPWFKARSDFHQSWLTLLQQQKPIHFSNHWLKQFTLSDVIALLRYTLQDCIAEKLEQNIQQQDLDISSLAQHYDLQQLFNLWQAIQQAQIFSQQNVQNTLIMDDLAIKLINTHRKDKRN